MADYFVDRKSTMPNRYKITPASGSSYYATLERADEPTEVGTALNAAVLNNLIANIANLYVWRKFLREPSESDLAISGDGYVVEDVENATLSMAQQVGTVQKDPYDSVSYAASFTYSDGVITLVNPTQLFLNSTSAASVLLGMYVHADTGLYYIAPSASFSKTSSGTTTVIHYISVDFAQKITPINSQGYVTSFTRGEYPENGEQDGYWYVYKKRLGD